MVSPISEASQGREENCHGLPLNVPGRKRPVGPTPYLWHMSIIKFVLRFALGLFLGRLALIFFRKVVMPLIGAGAIWFWLHRHGF